MKRKRLEENAIKRPNQMHSTKFIRKGGREKEREQKRTNLSCIQRINKGSHRMQILGGKQSNPNSHIIVSF